MRREAFNRLKEGTLVWFSPTYFTLPMVGVVKQEPWAKGIWVNFYGDGQCFFDLSAWDDEKFDKCVWGCSAKGNGDGQKDAP